MVKHLLVPLFLSLLTALSPLAHAQQYQPLQAFVDRTNITIHDVITLTLRLDTSMGNNRPTLTGLNQSFEQIGGLSVRSTYTNNNGAIQAWNEYSINLRPLTTGTLTIPAFRVGSQTTSPIQIKVTDAASGINGNNDEIFLRTSINKTDSYVQEQLLYTIRIYYSIGFDQGAQLSAPQVENAVVQQLGTDSNFQETVKGISYQVTERRFVMFPQKSGEFKIPPVLFNATIGRRGGINLFLNSRTAVREINLTSDSHVVNVKAQPDSFDGLTWLPAASLKLEEDWTGKLDNVHVGDAVTRNLTVTAAGLSSSLLPAITYKDIPGLRFYPDQPVREDSAKSEGVTGKRKDGTAIVASQPGDFVLPEMKLPWWNTTADRMEYATLPARTIKVLPALNAPDANSISPGVLPAVTAAGAGSNAGEPGGAGSNPLWISTTVLFAVLWAFTVLLYLRNRQQLAYAQTTGTAPAVVRMPATEGSAKAGTNSLPDAGTMLRVLKTACDNGNLADIRKALLKWGQGTVKDHDLLTLEQLARACSDEQLSGMLRILDQALYGTSSQQGLDTQALYARVAALHKQGINHTGTIDKFALPPLYKS